MSWINLGEVYYVVFRADGQERAENVIASLRPLLALEVAGADRTIEAATLKAQYALGLADAFAVATAIAHDAVLLTGDPDLLDPRLGCRVEDLR